MSAWSISPINTRSLFSCIHAARILPFEKRSPSSQVNISLETISVSSPTPRANNSVDSKTGVRISW